MAVAALGLLRWQDPAPLSWLVMPMLLAGILYDVAFTLCRRLLAGERLHEAHRGHLYQVAFRTGVPASRVALLHWGFVLWGGGLTFLLGRAAAAGCHPGMPAAVRVERARDPPGQGERPWAAGSGGCRSILRQVRSVLGKGQLDALAASGQARAPW